MKKICEVSFTLDKKNKIIYFGIPDTKEELDEMFQLRYNVYKDRKYIKTNVLSDKDEYDVENKCIYFIAKIDNHIIGTVRLILDEFLPTEKDCFNFEEPLEIKKISRNQRGELSRLIVIPPQKNYLPRHLVMLFLIKSIINYSGENNILGGYSFVTKNLYYKIKNLGIPFHIISSYDQIYPCDGLMHPYFSRKENPILPIYYLREEVSNYLENVFDKKKLVKKITEEKFILENNLYNKFLRFLKII